MKIIVAHASPDWDAIGSIWLIKKYLAGWQDADVQFVPAGERFSRGPVRSFPLTSARSSLASSNELRARENSSTSATPSDVVEKIGEDEVIHVDTGLGPLDHHQTYDTNISAASLTWEYVKKQITEAGDHFTPEHEEAISRLVKIIVETDHFKEVFWNDPAADYHEFSLLGLLDGYKLEKPNQDLEYVHFGMQCLNALFAEFENRIWAEKEIEENSRKFTTRFGQAIGFETINDTVLKLAQKMGYVIVVRKDPRKGYVRIKTLPDNGKTGADLTLAYEQLKKIDPEATWYLHVSKKMLLNGTPKNPKMKPTKLSLHDIIKVLERI